MLSVRLSCPRMACCQRCASTIYIYMYIYVYIKYVCACTHTHTNICMHTRRYDIHTPKQADTTAQSIWTCIYIYMYFHVYGERQRERERKREKVSEQRIPSKYRVKRRFSGNPTANLNMQSIALSRRESLRYKAYGLGCKIYVSNYGMPWASLMDRRSSVRSHVRAGINNPKPTLRVHVPK